MQQRSALEPRWTLLGSGALPCVLPCVTGKLFIPELKKTNLDVTQCSLEQDSCSDLKVVFLISLVH